MNTTIKKGENLMKRWIISLILTAFIVNAFYPVIYATENKMENVAQQEKAGNEDAANNAVENTGAIEDEKSEDNSVMQENVIKNETTQTPVAENTTNDITPTKLPAKVQKQTYIGKVYIDDPKYDQSFTVPNTNKITLKGWAVSTDSQASLKVYIDDEFAKIIETREKREDVDKSDVVSGYGGTATTPKAGFKESLDISSLNAGSHTIKIEQLSRDADVLNSESTKITVKVGTFKGKMNIDDPKNNKSYKLPNTETLKLKGWAVSNDSQATLKIYLDNKAVETFERVDREDVNKAVSGAYGGTATTPKAGFEGTVDISKLSNGNHKIKVEERARNGALICKQEITIKITQTVYQGKINIDDPKNNKSYKLPNTETLKLKGWAVSNDSQAILKIYVDNKLVETFERVDREDVNKKISGAYGGIQNTPKAGFEATIDISNFSEGTHKIKVEERSRYGARICKQEIAFKVSHTKYKGKINIDDPKNNKSYKLPNTETLKLKGWAVSNDSEAILRIYVDNKLVETFERVDREDVNRAVSGAYGGIQNTPKAGFEATIDISNFSAGTHKIKVEERSRYGARICKQEIAFKVSHTKYKGKMNIDDPKNNKSYILPDNETVNLKGWAVSNDSQAVLKIYVDNKSVKTFERVDREDVNRVVSGAYGGTQNTPKAGFEATIDVSKFSVGTHKIKVEERSRYGTVICSQEVAFKVKQKAYKGKINIDTKSPVTYDVSKKTTMNITGWAVSDDPNAYLTVRIDGAQASCSIERENRPDVDKKVSGPYGGTANTPDAGFIITANIAKLKEGDHTIEICEVSRFHKVVASSTMLLKVRTPHYKANMWIDDPSSSIRYRSGWIDVKGWAITELNGDYTTVYLDGIYQGKTQGKQDRADVKKLYGAKYPNYTQGAGFTARINGTGLTDGTHTIRVVHYSKYGKKLEEKSVTFVISNMISNGIDVSHYQGNIDWNAVRNAGIDFAIIRIGYMTNSVTTPVKDTYFERNYSECKKYGIAVGGYFYSYAINREHAVTEASHCLSMIQGKQFEMPIFIDIEDGKITNAFANGTLNRDGLTVIADTFCGILSGNRYKSGIYANKYFMENYLNMWALERYNVWLAHYAGSTNYGGRYDLWQYTSEGRVAGINGKVDLNKCFTRY